MEDTGALVALEGRRSAFPWSLETLTWGSFFMSKNSMDEMAPWVVTVGCGCICRVPGIFPERDWYLRVSSCFYLVLFVF